MTRAKRLNEIAEGIAEVTMELMHDSVDWQMGGFQQDGDDYEELHEYVLQLAIKKMHQRSSKIKTYVTFN